MSAVTILNSEIEYKTSLRHPIQAVFGAIQNEIFSIIDFLGYNQKDFVLNMYPLTIERVDGEPVCGVLLGCIRARLGEIPVQIYPRRGH